MLEKVVSSFSKEEQRNFKLFALRSHEDKERKDIQLFDMLRKEGEDFNFSFTPWRKIVLGYTKNKYSFLAILYKTSIV